MDLGDWSKIALILGAVVSTMTAMNLAGWFVLRAVFVSKTELGQALSGLSTDLGQSSQRRLDDAEARIEGRIAGMASGDDLAAVRVSIARVEGTMASVVARIDGLAALMQRLETPINLLVQHHLNGSDR